MNADNGELDFDSHYQVALWFTFFLCDSCSSQLDYDEPYDAASFAQKAKTLGWYAGPNHEVFCADCRTARGK